MGKKRLPRREGAAALGVLQKLERIGDKIPDATILFLWFIAITLIASFILSKTNFSAVHPTTGEELVVVNLLSADGFRRILSNIVANFQNYAVMAQVLTCMLGVGVCERSGFFETALRRSVGNMKGSDTKVILIFTFIAVMADCTGGVGFVVVPALGGMVWATMGRNPIAGMLCGYGAQGGAFAANLLLTSMDVLNASFTVAAAQMLDPSFEASPAMNYFFSATSVFVLTLVSSWVTVKFVEPRCGQLPHQKADDEAIVNEHIPTEVEKKALRAALIAVGIFVAVIVALVVPANGLLRDPETGSAISSSAPFMEGLPFLIALLFFVPGCVYGIKSGRFKKADDVCGAMADSMAAMGRFVAFAFFIAQFLEYFSWSNIGVILAIKGANALAGSGFPIFIVLVIFVFMDGALDLMIGSASAKWGLLAPIFVPMFMLLGYHPCLIQMCYRVGDAIMNPITPGLPYLAILLASIRKHDDSYGLGSVISRLLPYSISNAIALIAMLAIWFFFKLPMGPGAPMMLP